MDSKRPGIDQKMGWRFKSASKTYARKWAASVDARVVGREQHLQLERELGRRQHQGEREALHGVRKSIEKAGAPVRRPAALHGRSQNRG